MTRVIRAGLIQASLGDDVPTELESLKTHMIEKHLALIDDAANQGVEVLCLQELFYGPYFCAEQDRRWYAMAKKIPEGPTVRLMQDVAKRHGMTLVVPIYEESMAGVYYNTAAVLDSDGSYLGKYRKSHIPHLPPGFWEKFYFKPGNCGYPVFQSKVAKIGVYICYDRHFPEGRGNWVSRERKSCSILPPLSPVCRTTFGNWSNLPTRRLTVTSWVRLTG